MFGYEFMRTAFMASGIVAVLSGLVGYFLVLRNQTFAGHALSHVGFTGATGAILVGVSPLWGLVGFTLLAGLAMGALGEKLSARDVAIGMTLSLALGFGLLFLHFYTAFATQATALLFGNVLGVDRTALLSLAGLAVLSVAALAFVSRPLLFASLQPELAEARGLPTRLLSTVFLGIVAMGSVGIGPDRRRSSRLHAHDRAWRRCAEPDASVRARDRALRRTCSARGLGRFDVRVVHRLARELLDHGSVGDGLRHQSGVGQRRALGITQARRRPRRRAGVRMTRPPRDGSSSRSGVRRFDSNAPGTDPMDLDRGTGRPESARRHHAFDPGLQHRIAELVDRTACVADREADRQGSVSMVVRPMIITGRPCRRSRSRDDGSCRNRRAVPGPGRRSAAT